MTRRTLTVLITVIGLLGGACGGDDDGVAATIAPDAGVHAAGTDLGEVLVDPDGFTLYVFTADSAGGSTCYDACAELWPPVPGNTSIGGDLDDSVFGTTVRNDGADQLTVHGRPLYRYAPDAGPGDTTGQGFNDVWFVVDATGSPIGAPDAGATANEEDSSSIYDY